MITIEQSTGLGGCNLGNGPCIPCAGLWRTMEGSVVTDQWGPEWGLRENIPYSAPAGFERLFPASLSADEATWLWYSATSAKLDIAWSYEGFRAEYHLIPDPQQPLNFIWPAVHTGNRSFGMFGGTTTIDIPISRPYIGAPTYGKKSPIIPAYTGANELPYSAVQLATYDYVGPGGSHFRTWGGVPPSARSDGLVDCPIIHSYTGYAPEIAWLLRCQPTLLHQGLSRAITEEDMRTTLSISPCLLANNLTSQVNGSTPSDYPIYAAIIPVTYHVKGRTFSSSAWVAFHHFAFSSDGNLPSCFAESYAAPSDIIQVKPFLLTISGTAGPGNYMISNLYYIANVAVSITVTIE